SFRCGMALQACPARMQSKSGSKSDRDGGIQFTRYLQGPGTGMTNLPSFSAIKFSVVLVELPFSSFFSITITSFFVGLRLRKAFSCSALAARAKRPEMITSVVIKSSDFMEELRMLRNSRNREEMERRFPFCRSIHSVPIKIIAYDNAHIE